MFAQAKAPRHARFAWPRLTVRGLRAWLSGVDALYRERAHLRELDDRMLSDIGVTRADVAAELARPLIERNALVLRRGYQF